MEKILKQSVGIDIAKDEFSSCFSTINPKQEVQVVSNRIFPNNPAGFRAFLKWAKKLAAPGIDLVFALEATGVYHEGLAWHLYEADCYVSVLLPVRVKRYAQSLPLKTKTDKVDAQVISRLACERRLEQWAIFSPTIYTLRELTREHESLQKEKTRLTGQIHAKQHAKVFQKETLKRLQRHLRMYDKFLEEVKAQIQRTIDQDDKLRRKAQLITSIPGVGMLTFATIIAETNGFALFRNARQLVSYAGFDVVQNQSGNRVGKTRISKKGNSHIRRALYFPALSAKMCSPQFANFFERVIRNKASKMIGVVALQRKLLVLIYTLWMKDMPFDPELIKQNPKEETTPQSPKEKPDKNSRRKEVKPSFRLNETPEQPKMNLNENEIAGALSRSAPATLDRPQSDDRLKPSFRLSQI